jgi:hypothetical protein
MLHLPKTTGNGGSRWSTTQARTAQAADGFRLSCYDETGGPADCQEPGFRRTGWELLGIDIDNDEHAVGCVVVVDEEIEAMEVPISPDIEEEQLPLEVAGIGLRPVGGSCRKASSTFAIA